MPPSRRATVVILRRSVPALGSENAKVPYALPATVSGSQWSRPGPVRSAPAGGTQAVARQGRAVAVATAVAGRLAARPAHAVAEASRVIDLAPHGRREERAALDRLFATAEAADAIRAFVERRAGR